MMGQCSAFGAWLDVLVDNVGRSLLWTRLYPWGVFVSCLEWSVFVCTHTLGHQWKAAFGAAPQWVKTVMDNGFYTPVGVFAVAGLHVLPPYLYILDHLPPSLHDVSPILLYAPAVILATGRGLALAVELWCIKTHILQLLSTDENHKLNTLTRDLHTDPSN
jgi:CDP-diacylglycerol--inositol 3-phosphatidyltransferase